MDKTTEKTEQTAAAQSVSGPLIWVRTAAIDGFTLSLSAFRGHGKIAIHYSTLMNML